MQKKLREMDFVIYGCKDYKGGENGRYNKCRNPRGDV